MRLLDRYVLRNFFEPFFLCFFGFLAIWLVFDLSGNVRDFIDADASLKVIGGFYLTQFPQIITIVLPVGLLLALLFSLSKMSRSNEIISMLTAGRSVLRVIFPLLVIGVLASLFLLALNYELAPHAEAIKKVALEQISRGRKTNERPPIEGHLFRDRQTLRTWYVRKLRPGQSALDDVHIIQQDEEGNITRKWYANRATWDARTGSWVLLRGLRLIFDLNGNVESTMDYRTKSITAKRWPETPQRIASSSLEAQNLSVPELREYLQINSDFPPAQLAAYRTLLAHRFALPWSCLVVVFVAAPLGIVYSRRGVLAGVAISIFIFFGMIFVTNLFLALGKGSRIAPFAAAWVPNIVIGGIGLVLLYFRATNRDVPKLRFKLR